MIYSGEINGDAVVNSGVVVVCGGEVVNSGVVVVCGGEVVKAVVNEFMVINKWHLVKY